MNETRSAAPAENREWKRDDGPLGLDEFLASAGGRMITISAMAFQDAWTLDLDRLRQCCIHVFDPERGLVPFCAYNLTASDGKAAYRR